MSQLPVFQILLPLLAAPLSVILRRKTLVWQLATGVAWASLIIAWNLLQEVQANGPIAYHIGGWAPPFGIEYRIDILNAFVLLIVTGIAAVVFPYARRSVEAEIPAEKHHLFYAALLLCLTGLLGIVITGDAFNVFVFLEVASLSTYSLISLGKDKRSLTSAFQYLVMGTMGGTSILIGIGLMYAVTGSLNMEDLAIRMAAMEDKRTLLVAFTFFCVGISLKLAVFPLHQWLPNAYTYAPSTVTAFVAATFTKVSFYVLLRVIFTLFGADLAFLDLHFDKVLLVLGLLGVFTGSLVAIYQENIKRMLAYSSVAQIGYMIIGISFYSVNGLTGGIVHLFNHALMKGGLFMVMGCILLRLGSVQLSDMRGLGRRMPLTMAAFVVGGLSLIGVPLTVGFVSKWYLILAALENNLWPVALLMLVSSLLAVMYIWRVIEVAYFQKPDDDAPELREAPTSMLVTTWIMVGATVVFGVFTEQTAGVARQAAAFLLGVSP